jgi:predicted nucleic acid-binding protein
MIVREVCGKGGRSGKRYEVALSSLSETLQEAYCGIVPVAQSVEAIAAAPRPALNQGAKIEYRWRVIQEAIEAPVKSAERAAEVKRAARKWGEPVRTIYNWIAALEEAGGDMNALAHKRPSDAGQIRRWQRPTLASQPRIPRSMKLAIRTRS